MITSGIPINAEDALNSEIIEEVFEDSYKEQIIKELKEKYPYYFIGTMDKKWKLVSKHSWSKFRHRKRQVYDMWVTRT